jgi:hypothetical protein
VTLAVGDVPDQAVRLAKRVQHAVNDVDVVLCVLSGNIVRLAADAVMQRKVDAGHMVLDVQPVAHLPSVAVDWQRFVVDRLSDEQRQQLFGILIRAIGVAAACHHRIHPVRDVICTHHQLAAGFAGRVGAVRQEMVVLQRQPFVDVAIHLVRADLYEAADSVFPALVKQDVHADDVSMHERVRGQDAAVDVAFGGEVDDCVDLVGFEYTPHVDAVGDVGALEAIILFVVDSQQVIEVACIRQFIQHDDGVVWILFDHVTGEGAADETSRAGDEDVFHFGAPFL